MLSKIKFYVAHTCLISIISLSSFFLSANDEVEIIEVKGKRTIHSIEKDMIKAQFAFFDQMNAINDLSKFDMLCSVRKGVGSNIAKKVCEPRYFVDARSRLIQDRAYATLALDISKLPNDADVHMVVKRDKEDYVKHIQKLLMENPELLEQWVSLQAKVKKFNQRKESTDR